MKNAVTLEQHRVTQEQIENYIERYAKEHTETFSLELVQKLLKEQKDLKEILIDPFMLTAFVQASAKLFSEKKYTKDKINGISIKRAEIYAIIFKNWFDIARSRLEQSVQKAGLLQKGKELEDYFYDYATKLANYFFAKGETEVCYQPDIEHAEYQKTDEALKIFFSDESPDQEAIRESCPVKRNEAGVYRFVHKSFQDYLVSKYIYQKLQRNQLGDISDALNVRYLIDEIPVLVFTSEMIACSEEQKRLESLLLNIVMMSKEDESNKYIKASSNAISILNWNRYSFAGKDLRGIRMPKAYLEEGNFYKSDLSGADLRESQMRNIELSKANLSGSDCRGVVFGEYPEFLLEKKFMIMAFNKECTQLATSCDSEINIWNCPSGELLKVLKGHHAQVKSVSFNLDGKRLASASSDNTVRLWDVEKGEVLLVLRERTEQVSLSMDGKRLGTMSWDNRVRVWSVASGELLQECDDVYSISFSMDGKWLACGGDKAIRLLDVENGGSLRILQDSKGLAKSLSFSIDGKQLASGDHYGMIKLWDVERGELLRVFKGPKGPVKSLCFSMNGKRLASGSDDRFVRLWDLERGELSQIFEGHKSRIQNVDFSMDNKWLVSEDGRTLRFWNVEREELNRVLESHGSCVDSISLSIDGNWLASASSHENMICLWNVETGKLRRVLGNKDNNEFDCIDSVSLSMDGKWLASGGSGKIIRLWDVEREKVRVLENNSEKFITRVSLNMNEKRLVVGSSEGMIQLWDVENDKLIRLFYTGGIVRDLSFSMDGKRLAVSLSGGKEVQLWDVVRGELNRVFEVNSSCDTNDVYCVDLSMDAKQLLSGSKDGMIHLWDVETGNLSRAFQAHTNEVTCASFSMDGKYIASGSSDCTVRLWDIESGDCIQKIKFNFFVRTISWNVGRDIKLNLEECQNNVLGVGTHNRGVYIFRLKDQTQSLSRENTFLLSWRTEFFLRAYKTNLTDIKTDDMNRRLLEQRGAKAIKSFVEGSSQIISTQGIFANASSSLQSIATPLVETDVVRISQADAKFDCCIQ